jgi:hypothetical protein
MHKHPKVVGLVLGIFVLAAAAWTSLSPQKTEDDASSKVFPGLERQINSIDHIALTQAMGPIILKRKDGAWFVSGYDGLPAQFSAVRRTLVSLADAKIIEEKTKDPKHYASLAVDDPKTKGSQAQSVVLSAGEKEVISFIMGKEEPLLSGSLHPDLYVRVKDTVYWTRGGLPFLKDPKAYLDPVLWALDASRLKEVSWVTDKIQGLARRQTPFQPSWQEGEGAALADKTRVILESIIHQWAASLAFSDLKPADAFKDQSPVLTVSFSTFDGFHASLKGYQDAQKKSLWAVLEAKTIEAKSPAAWEKQKPKDFTGSLELQPHDVVASDVAELQAKADRWAFRISPYPADFLLHKAEKALDNGSDKTKTRDR